MRLGRNWLFLRRERLHLSVRSKHSGSQVDLPNLFVRQIRNVPCRSTRCAHARAQLIDPLRPPELDENVFALGFAPHDLPIARQDVGCNRRGNQSTRKTFTDPLQQLH